MKVTSLEEGKAAAINQVGYYWDGKFLFPSPVAPFPAEIQVLEEAKVGMHGLGLRCQVLVVDFPICFAYLEYPVKVIPKVDPRPKGTAKIIEKHSKLEKDK